MAKLKMLRYPKKPKAGASVAAMEKYLQRVRDIDKENRSREATNRKALTLRKKIAGIGSASSRKSYKRGGRSRR